MERATEEAAVRETAAKPKELKGFYKLLDDKRKRYIQKQIDQATAWVLKTFADIILFEGKGEKRIARLFMRRFVVEPRHRDAGLTKLPDGWTVGISLLAEDFALAYIDTILDETIAEEDKLKALLKLIRIHSYGHGQYFERWPEMDVEFPKGDDA